MDTTNFKMSLHENSIADLKQLILDKDYLYQLRLLHTNHLTEVFH